MLGENFTASPASGPVPGLFNDGVFEKTKSFCVLQVTLPLQSTKVSVGKTVSLCREGFACRMDLKSRLRNMGGVVTRVTLHGELYSLKYLSWAILGVTLFLCPGILVSLCPLSRTELSWVPLGRSAGSLVCSVIVSYWAASQDHYISMPLDLRP